MANYAEEILRRSQERRKQAAQAEQYAQFKQETLEGDVARGQSSAIKALETMKATSDVGGAGVFRYGAPVRPDRMLAIERALADEGVLDIGGGASRPRFGRDFMQARAVKGARDVVINDRPAVVGERGELLAFDPDGDPGVMEHFASAGQGGTRLGAAMNAMGRPLQALVSGGGAVVRGHPERALKAAGEGFAGSTGGKTFEAGGDVIQSFTAAGRAAGLSPEAAVAAGLVPDLILDPLNAVPVGRVLKAARAGLKAAEATRAGKKVAAGVDSVHTTVRTALGLPTSEADAARALTKTALADQGGELARTISEAPSVAAARSARTAERNLATIEEAKGLVPKGSDRAVFDAAESTVRHLDDPGEILDAVARLEPRGLAPDIAEPIERARAISPRHRAVLTEYPVKMRGLEEELAAARAASQAADAEKVVRKMVRTTAAYNRVLRGYKDIVGRAHNIASEAGAPLALVRDAEKMSDVERSAALLSSMMNRQRETLGELGLVKNADDLSKNYMPHVIEGSNYAPWKQRHLVASDEMEQLREKVLTSPTVDQTIVDAFQSNVPDDMAAMRSAARAATQTPAKTHSLADAEAALARSSPDAKFSEDPFFATAKHGEVMQFAEARARTGKMLAEAVDDNGVRLAIPLRDFVENVAKGAMPGVKPGAKVAARRALLLGTSRPKFMGLGDGVPKAKDWTLSTSTRELLRQTGYELVDAEVARKMPALAGMVVPSVVADEVRMLAGSMEPGALERAAQMISGVNAYWAPLVLATPGFHIRNATYGMFQVYLDIGEHIGNPRLWAMAHQISSLAEHGGRIEGVVQDVIGAKKSVEGISLAQLVDEIRKLGVVETGRTADLSSIAKKSLRYKGETGVLQALNPASKNFALGKASKFVGAELPTRLMGALAGVAGGAPGMIVKGASASPENVQRTLVYLARRLKMGASPLEARQHVMTSMFDYTGMRLSRVEKGLRKLFPFYQWVRFSMQQTIGAMLKDPARFNNIQKLFSAVDSMGEEDPQFSDRYSPDYLEEKGAVRVPEALAKALRSIGVGSSPGTAMRWVMERPGTQLNQDPGKLAGESLGPGAKIPMETFLTNTAFGTGGRYLFGGGEISPGFREGPWNNALENALNMDQEDMLPYLLSQFGSATGIPARALLGGAGPRNTQLDEKDKVIQSILSAVLGQKFATFDPREVLSSRVAEGNALLQDVSRGRMYRARRSPGIAWE